MFDDGYVEWIRLMVKSDEGLDVLSMFFSIFSFIFVFSMCDLFVMLCLLIVLIVEIIFFLIGVEIVINSLGILIKFLDVFSVLVVRVVIDIIRLGVGFCVSLVSIFLVWILEFLVLYDVMLIL